MKADPEIDGLHSRLFVSIRGLYSNTMRRQRDGGFEKRANCGARRAFSDQEKLEVLGDPTFANRDCHCLKRARSCFSSDTLIRIRIEQMNELARHR
jgi:hypothetical protein